MFGPRDPIPETENGNGISIRNAFRETVMGDTKRSSFENMTGLIPRVYIYEYRTKLGMTKVVLRGSWGCH